MKHLFHNSFLNRLFIGIWLGLLGYLLTIFFLSYLPRLSGDFSWLEGFQSIDHQLGTVGAAFIFVWYWKAAKKKS